MLDKVCVGIPAIASEFGTSPQQIDRWANLPSDPLRLEYLHGVPRMRRSRMQRWWRRNREDGRGEKKTLGWATIAALAELSLSAAWRAAKEAADPLPVHRLAEGEAGEGRVWAWESAIEDWRDARLLPRAAHLRQRPRRGQRKIGAAKGRVVERGRSRAEDIQTGNGVRQRCQEPGTGATS